MAKKIHLTCPCGEMLAADDEDELVKLAEEHLEQEHPNIAGSYTREQILALAW